VQRVLIFGRGGAGKSTLATRLGQQLGLPVIELDQLFWSSHLEPMPPDRWEDTTAAVAAADRWIIEGDLGPFDVLAPRLVRADTIIVLDYSLSRCAWRSLRRGREQLDFWRWVISWRRRSRPQLLTSLQQHAPDTPLHLLRKPRDCKDLLPRLRPPAT
jgi:adenylate kinase family enzyme